MSLADRLYGIKIAAVQPVKAVMHGTCWLAPLGHRGSTSTDMLVEVIGSVGAPAGAAPVPLPVPEVQLDLPPVPLGEEESSALCVPWRSSRRHPEPLRSVFVRVQWCV